MKELRFICCQPAIPYYTWQVEVMINNFIKNGVNGNQMDIVCAVQDSYDLTDWKKLQNKYNYVRFFFYDDTREDKRYAPSIYFNMLKQHIEARPEIKTEPWFLYDCDTIFTRRILMNNLKKMGDDNIWYMSNTNSYINYDYIISKGNDVYEGMCKIIGLNPLIPKLMNSNSGGAQYIVKNTTSEFWNKVELDSIELYKLFCESERNWDKDYYPIQKWTAGMWSLLWNAWLYGNETKVDTRLNFTWAPNPINELDEVNIFHNAGVLNGNGDLFFKGKYVASLPYNEQLEINPNKCSYFYWKEICETAKNSVLI
jgi:hypothetical protein